MSKNIKHPKGGKGVGEKLVLSNIRARVDKLQLTAQMRCQFLQTVLLKRIAHSFTYAYGCFCATLAELSSCNRDYMAAKPKTFTVRFFT